MIAGVNTPQRRARYLAACAGKPVLGCLLPVHLALFGKCGNFFAAPTLALDINGRGSIAAGHANPEELASFLCFAGKDRILTDGPAPAGWRYGSELHIYTLEAGHALPMPAAPNGLTEPAGAVQAGECGTAAEPAKCPATGLTLNVEPSSGAVADFLFPGEQTRRDAFYADLCTKRNHAMARVWTLEQGRRVVCTVGAYALYAPAGEAYMACGETLEELRGRGIGGWLIAKMANELAAEGWCVRFLCHDERVHFYTRLGFVRTGTLQQYLAPETEEEPHR